MSANGEVAAPDTKRGLVNREEVFHSSLTPLAYMFFSILSTTLSRLT